MPASACYGTPDLPVVQAGVRLRTRRRLAAFLPALGLLR